MRSYVKFRIFQMPCCHTMICWVNHRLPNYCPECGKRVYFELKFKPEYTQLCDDTAYLQYKDTRDTE